MNLIIKTLLIQILQFFKYSQKVLMILSWGFLIIMLLVFVLIAIEGSVVNDFLWSLIEKLGFSSDYNYSGDDSIIFQVYFWVSLIFYSLTSLYYFIYKKPKVNWTIKKRFKLNFISLVSLYILVLITYTFLPGNKEDIFFVVIISFIVSSSATIYYIIVSSFLDNLIKLIDSKIR